MYRVYLYETCVYVLHLMYFNDIYNGYYRL